MLVGTAHLEGSDWLKVETLSTKTSLDSFWEIWLDIIPFMDIPSHAEFLSLHAAAAPPASWEIEHSEADELLLIPKCWIWIIYGVYKWDVA